MNDAPTNKIKIKALSAGLLFFFAVIFSIVWGYNSLLDWAVNKNKAPINQVEVHGDLRYLDEQELVGRIKQKIDGSFFSLDVDKLQRKLADDPWIYGVSIRKEWPTTLHVFVVEQQPIALWNNDLLLNRFGDVFFSNGIEVSDPLPRLYGPEGKEKDVLKGYADMQSLLELNEFSISELVLSERFAWQVWLDRGIHLNLGRKEKMKRLQRFIDLAPLLNEYNDKQVAAVDLRYDIGLAVSWLEQ